MEPSTHLSSLRRYFERYTLDVQEAINFLEWLQIHPLEIGTPSIRWEQPSFRIIYGELNPLSIAGSLAAGGRFNIGGAQVSHFFPHLKMEGCLYTASSLDCAKKEAGEPLGNARFFAIKPKKILNLWDLHLLIRTVFHYPELEAHVNASPLAAIWRYQKVPKLSQILGSFLRKKGGDGLVYPSTKDKEGLNIAFFAKDDLYTQRIFELSEIIE